MRKRIKIWGEKNHGSIAISTMVADYFEISARVDGRPKVSANLYPSSLIFNLKLWNEKLKWKGWMTHVPFKKMHISHLIVFPHLLLYLPHHFSNLNALADIFLIQEGSVFLIFHAHTLQPILSPQTNHFLIPDSLTLHQIPTAWTFSEPRHTSQWRICSVADAKFEIFTAIVKLPSHIPKLSKKTQIPD